MNRLIAALILFLFPALALATTVASWRLDEGGGLVVRDSSGNAHTGSITGSAIWVAGKISGALNFDGVSARVLVPTHTKLNPTTAMSIAAWIKPAKVGTQYMVKKARVSSSNGYELSLSSSGKIFVRFNQVTSGDAYRLNSLTSYPSDGNTWMHVAATFDGATIRLYVNGVQDNTLSAPGLVIASNSRSLALGAQDNGVSPFKGGLDEVSLYNHALSAAEAQALYATSTDSVWLDGFEGVTKFVDLFPEDLTRWTSRQSEGTPANVVALEDVIVHSGEHSLKTHAGPYDGTTASKASIGQDLFKFAAGDDFWFSGWFYIVGGTNTQNVFLVDLEEAGGTSPGRRLFLTGGDAILACDSGKFPVPASTIRQTPGKEIAIPKDVWVKIDLHLHLSADELTGKVEVWQNDVKILDGASRTLPAATSIYNRLQVGITANGNTASAQTVYVDDITVSKTPLR